MDKYKNNRLSIDERVDNLLSLMTLKEKIGQLNQKIYGWNAYKKAGDSFEITDAFKDEVAFGDGLGALYGLFRADPWSGVTFENGIPVQESAKVANRIQRYLMETTRLGIPVLLSEECPHGHQALGSTLFSTNIGIGSTWNPILYKEAFSFVAAEIRSRGAHMGLISALDVLQDPRWGRAEECYGEDPFLISKMASAVVEGLQGSFVKDRMIHNDKIIAVLKHFCGQGAAIGAHNGKSTNIGERELREIHLSGMKAGVNAGALGCMAAYNDLDGVPCHANRKLLTEILRGEWGFEGIVMSDGGAIDLLTGLTGNHESAGAMALSAGIDLNLWSDAFMRLDAAVKSGKVSEELIDRAVRRILRLKFLLGLFEEPYTDETRVIKTVGTKRAREINLKVARESIVLLKNKDDILPLKKDMDSIAIIGPNADSIYNQLGDYTPAQINDNGITVLQGVRALVSEGTRITYEKGCGIRNTSREGFKAAIKAAKESDVAIVVLGGNSTRNFNMIFEANGATAVSDNPIEMDCGEGVDVADLELGGVQVELVKEIIATGIPVITVLIQGRPHSIPWVAENSAAILCAWYPGQEGGQAVAEILFGDVNPSGKLSVSIPRSSAQLPVYYNYKGTSDYVDMTAKPLYPFGYGLSYTSFKYSNLRLLDEKITIEDLQKGKTARITIDMENTGDTAGAEVVQLYIRDMEASITRRTKELKGFNKIWLEPGEKKTIMFSLSAEELGIWNNDMQYIVEPGNVKVMIGYDSQNLYECTLKITN